MGRSVKHNKLRLPTDSTVKGVSHGRSQLKVPTDGRTQVYGAPSFLVVTIQVTNWDRHCSTSMNEPLSLLWTQTLGPCLDYVLYIRCPDCSFRLRRLPVEVVYGSVIVIVYLKLTIQIYTYIRHGVLSVPKPHHDNFIWKGGSLNEDPSNFSSVHSLFSHFLVSLLLYSSS